MGLGILATIFWCVIYSISMAFDKSDSSTGDD
jgi:hypothetical protein